MEFLQCALLLLVAQVTAEFGGLGPEFQPTVKASCVGGTMTVRVDTKEPFYGLVQATSDPSEPGCSELGRGGLKTFLTLDLTVADRCGMKFNKASGERSIVVSVRAHQSLALLEDRLFTLRCGRAGFQTGGQTLAQLAITSDGEHRLEAALEESSYAIRASVTAPDPTKGLLVKNCRAFDGLGASVELVDDRACRAEKLISEFTYYDSSGYAVATLFSLFRMPNSNRTHFQCDLEICSGPCPKPVCGGLYTGSDAAGLQSVSEDTVTTSTSVYVAPPGSSLAASLCGLEGEQGGEQPDWLTGLAIAFGVLFAIMLFINIFLCSAMTCSCTRTEVIEKEPSIYDEDYSVYESQYGYAGKQGPYSESELGSEYGEGAGSQTGARRPGSEAGTLASRFSQRQQAALDSGH